MDKAEIIATLSAAAQCYYNINDADRPAIAAFLDALSTPPEVDDGQARAQVESDALLYGTGFLVDGRRVDPSRVSMLTSPLAAPASDAGVRNTLEAIANAAICPPLMSEQAAQMMSWQKLARAALTAPHHPAEKAVEVNVLSQDDILACMREANITGTVRVTFDSGPHDITSPTVGAVNFVRAIERRLASAPQADQAVAGAAGNDEVLERLIDDSDGRWHDGEFRIEGHDLMELLRAVQYTPPAASEGDGQ